MTRYCSVRWCMFLGTLLMGGVMTTSAQELDRDGNVVVKRGGSDEAVTVELYSEEKPLGGDSPILAKEGTVSYNCSIKRLSGKGESLALQGDTKNWDVYSLYFPITLHETPSTRYYEKLIFHVSLNVPSATALLLFPKEVESREEIEKTFGLSPEVKVKDLALTLGSYTVKEKYTRFRSKIRAMGVGQNSFYWTYLAFGDGRIEPGDKEVLAIVQVPRGTKKLSGEIYYEAVMAKELFSKFWPTKVYSDRKPFNWLLGR